MSIIQSPYAIVIVGLFLSVVAGHYIVVLGLRFFLSGTSKPHPRGWGVGCVERFIYTSCTILGLTHLVAGWLVLKGLAQFRPKGDGTHTTEDYLTDYYGYLIGTGLSIIVGIGFGLISRYCLGLEVAPDNHMDTL